MSPAIAMDFEDACSSLKLSKQSFIELAIIAYLDDKDAFVICPQCETYLAVKDLLNTVMPVKRFYCGCGTTIWYATKGGYIIDWKIRPTADNKHI
jgi:hypothetical protein